MEQPAGIDVHRENIADYREIAASVALFDQIVKTTDFKPSDDFRRNLALMQDYLSGMRRVSRSTGEEKVCAVFDHFIANNPDVIVPAAFAGSVVSSRREVRLASGVLDRLLTLSDGSVVAVEVKAPGSRRDHVCGLGQVLMYAAALRESGEYPNVEMMLVCGGSKDQWVASACRTAGVHYMDVPHGIVKIIDDYGVAAGA